MIKKCPPVPSKISKAAIQLKEGNKKEWSKAGKDMKKHQDEKH